VQERDEALRKLSSKEVELAKVESELAMKKGLDEQLEEVSDHYHHNHSG